MLISNKQYIEFKWDGAPIHNAQPIKDYLTAGVAKYIQLERLPAYAPELNPDEGIWQYQINKTEKLMLICPLSSMVQIKPDYWDKTGKVEV